MKLWQIFSWDELWSCSYRWCSKICISAWYGWRFVVETIYDTWTIQAWNMIFTSFPMVAVMALDFDVMLRPPWNILIFICIDNKTWSLIITDFSAWFGNAVYCSLKCTSTPSLPCVQIVSPFLLPIPQHRPANHISLCSKLLCWNRVDVNQ